MASLLYSSPLLLGLALRIKYGRFYRIRLERVSKEVLDGSKVVDLCCGDCAIYLRCLRRKRVDYLGVDVNRRMVRLMKRRGIQVLHADVRSYNFPPCDVLLCLASLYQFSDQAAHLIQSAQDIADKVVLLEPVENLACSKYPWAASLAAKITDFGEGPVSFRFEEEELTDMWRHLGFTTIERIGPELLGIWSRSGVRVF